MADLLKKRGYRLVTGGTENHQVLIDLTGMNITGAKAEKKLESVGIVLNRNVVPQDAEHLGRVSGLRIGTGAIATRGMGKNEVTEIVELLDCILCHPDDQKMHEDVGKRVEGMCLEFPIYGQ